VTEARRHPGRLRLHRSRKGERLSMSKADYADQAARPDSSEDSLPLTAESHSEGATHQFPDERFHPGQQAVGLG
jgi:hypothetical protein